MKLLDFSMWDIDSFPPLIWSISSDLGTTLYGIILLLVMFIAYLLLCNSVFSRLTTRKDAILGASSLIFFLGSLSLISWIAEISIGPQISLISIVAHLLLVHLILAVIISGAWFAKMKDSTYPPKLADYLRSNFWLGSLSFSILMSPIIIFKIIMVEPMNQTVYWGSVLFALVSTTLIFKYWIDWSFVLLKVKVDADQLPENLLSKFNQAKKPLVEAGVKSILLVRPGFRNALAYKAKDTVYLGVDLLQHLSMEEVKAVLLHELGHLKDEIFIPRLRKIILLAFFLYAAFTIFNQLDVISSFAELAIFLGGVFLFIIIMRKFRLKSEYVADSFVKGYSDKAHEHLLSGIEKLRNLNLVDKDYCKQKNAAHLDLDERKKLAEEGRFVIKRKLNLRSALSVFIVIAFMVGLQVVLAGLLPSSSSKWRGMHDNYHNKLQQGEYDDALTQISEAYRFSRKHFGSIHNRTYLSLIDLSKVSLKMGNVENADKYAVKAVELGQKLYKDKNYRQIRSLNCLADVYQNKRFYEEYGKVHARILQIQERTGEIPRKIGATLLSIAKAQIWLQDPDQTRIAVQRLLDFYRDQKGPEEELFSVDDMLRLLDNDSEVLSSGIIDDYLFQLEEIAEHKYGQQSYEYASFFSEYGYYFDEHNEKQKAKEAYTKCIDLFVSLGAIENEDYGYCLYNLAVLSQEDHEFDAAQRFFLESIKVEKAVNGEDTLWVKYESMRLADIYAQQHRVEDAKQYYRIALDLEEDDPDQELERLLHGYKSLLNLLDSTQDSEEISILQRKIDSVKSDLSSISNPSSQET